MSIRFSAHPIRSIAPALVAGFLLALVLAAPVRIAFAAPAPDGDADQTLSPYFMVLGDDPSVDQLPLKSTAAEVDIAGVIADVRVTQTYKNEGKRNIEAVYVFPASTRAAVYAMKMTIGERTIVAEIQEKEQARQTYEEAKEAGKSVSLLEQKRPNVFQMKVANILPGDTIEVELKYTELLVPTDGVYEFVYPTVVGPRYSNVAEGDAPESEKWVKNPYLHKDEPTPYDFDFSARIAAGMPISEVVCPSHEVSVDFDGADRATVRLDPEESDGGDRDVILKYRLAGENIQTGLLLYEGENENFFLLMAQPPERVETEAMPPREYIFVLDVSGSMRGFPLETAKAVMRDLVGNLQPADRFNVLLFSGDSRVLAEKSLAGTPENLNKAIAFIDRRRGGGGTELLPALRRALGLSSAKEVSRTVVVVTDGYVRVEAETFDLIRNRLNEANLFAFGIGAGVNRHLIEGMARVGMGEPFVVTDAGAARKTGERFRDYVAAPVLTDVSVDFNRFRAYDVEPPAIPDVLAERPVIVFGKWKGKTRGNIEVSGRTPEGAYKETLAVSDHAPKPENGALRYLWARHRIALLSDYQHVSADDDRVETITKLGLEYNLLTAYTSFVAVDSEVRADGDAETVAQPLPLPRGVPETAVGRGIARSARTFAASPAPAPSAMPDLAQKGLVGGAEPELDEGLPEPESAPPAYTVELVGDKMVIQGALSGELVERVFRRHMEEIATCARGARESGGPAESEVTLRVVIGGDGKVQRVEVRPNGKPNGKKGPVLESCVSAMVRQWEYDMPVDGQPVTVDYVFRLRPRS